MDNFGLLPPAEQAARLHALALAALDLWPFETARVEPIKVRENAVFAVHMPCGRRVALRIHRQGYHSDAALMSELTWMQALNAHGIDVPTPVLSTAGRAFELVDRPDVNGPRQVDIFEWIEGQELAALVRAAGDDTAALADVYRVVGELAARMHNQSDRWVAPSGFQRHAWNRDAFVGSAPLWGQFWMLEQLTPAQRDLLLEVRRRAHAELDAFGTAADRFGLIHADLVPENVLVEGKALRIIDFDDAGYGWHMFEIATSLYFIRREPFYPIARDALIEGYRRHRQLSDEHLQRLPLFLAVRSTTYLGWVHTRKGEAAARDLTPALIEMAVAAAHDYLGAGAPTERSTA